MLNQQTYKVVSDTQALADFINWLPQLQAGETYYCALLARSKYVRDLGLGTFNSDRHQCSRFLSNPDRLAAKIKQTEAPLGSYVIKDIEIPQEALAFYMNVNPRSHLKAQPLMAEKIIASLATRSTDVNLQQMAMTAVHRTVGRKLFVDFDFDDVDISDIIKNVRDAINPEAVSVVTTRGGYHTLVRLDAVEQKFKNAWYKCFRSVAGVDVVGDTLLPVPGTIQGGFVPVMQPMSHYL